MPYPMKQKEQQMITEQDIVFDNLYEDIATKLDSIMDEVIADIEDEEGIQHSMMMRIVETWSLGCLLYTSPSPRDGLLSRMPSSA